MTTTITKTTPAPTATSHRRIVPTRVSGEVSPSPRAACAVTQNNSKQIGVITETYDVVLADPPWSYYGQQDKEGAAANHYPTMNDDELLAFNVRERFMNDRSVLFMWATGPRLDFALRCIHEWGLTYRGLAFVWVKTRADGSPIGAQGVRPSIVKPTAELVLAASQVAKGRPLKLQDERIRQVVMARKSEHSRKPDDVHASIERMYPTARKIELFARRARPGWAAWGNEVARAVNDDAAT